MPTTLQRLDPRNLPIPAENMQAIEGNYLALMHSFSHNRIQVLHHLFQAGSRTDYPTDIFSAPLPDNIKGYLQLASKAFIKSHDSLPIFGHLSDSQLDKCINGLLYSKYLQEKSLPQTEVSLPVPVEMPLISFNQQATYDDKSGLIQGMLGKCNIVFKDVASQPIQGHVPPLYMSVKFNLKTDANKTVNTFDHCASVGSGRIVTDTPLDIKRPQKTQWGLDDLEDIRTLPFKALIKKQRYQGYISARTPELSTSS
jgi:hypothetical protein